MWRAHSHRCSADTCQLMIINRDFKLVVSHACDPLPCSCGFWVSSADHWTSPSVTIGEDICIRTLSAGDFNSLSEYVQDGMHAHLEAQTSLADWYLGIIAFAVIDALANFSLQQTWCYATCIRMQVPGSTTIQASTSPVLSRQRACCVASCLSVLTYVQAFSNPEGLPICICRGASA